MQSLGWYLNRFSLMSPAEWLSRVRQSLGDVADRLGPHRVPAKLAAYRIRMPEWPAPVVGEATKYMHSADRVLSGDIDLFGSWHVPSTPGWDWNADPLSGIRAPMKHGKFLDYRNQALAGNARNTWELNRHMQFVTLAQAWALGGDDKYADGVTDLLSAWIRECPYPRGINWASALEAGIRLINWYMSARLLGDRKGHTDADWLNSIYWHCSFVWRNQSRYSSANNHLIGEMAGLYVASTAWPCWPESQGWRASSKAMLEAEILRQVHEDGVLREQSCGYALFVLQFMLVAGLVGELEGDPFSTNYWKTFRKMLAFLASVADADGHLPNFGDADEGMVFLLPSGTRSRTFEELVKVDALFSGRGVIGCPTGSLESWLAQGFPNPQGYPQGTLEKREAFPNGGYYVLSNQVGTTFEELIVFDAGPLGFLSIAAHGHADCLSFVMSLGGTEVLIDPGTYCYHQDKAWRDYFRSTAAHNTLRVDGQDQSVMGGPFMWLRKACPQLEEFYRTAARQSVAASHDGYTRLKDSVTHRRTLELLPGAASLTVTDELKCGGSHQTERFWHFAEGLQVSLNHEGIIVAECSDFRFEIVAGSECSIALHTGSVEPRAGWVSRKFGALSATTTAVMSAPVDGNTTLKTLLRWTML